MMQGRTSVRTPGVLAGLLVTVLAAFALPAVAAAVAPGANGKIIFTSGRPPAPNDAGAQLWTVPDPGGSPVQITNNQNRLRAGRLQHRRAGHEERQRHGRRLDGGR